MRFFSRSTGTTYIQGVHGFIPEDAVEISEEIFNECFASRPIGKVVLVGDDGMPYLSDPPPPTYRQALDALNLAYQADVEKFNRAFAIAYLSDGLTQEPKQAAIRSQYEARKNQHAADSSALKVQYGIEG
jgi:hypothetical protein